MLAQPHVDLLPFVPLKLVERAAHVEAWKRSRPSGSPALDRVTGQPLEGALLAASIGGLPRVVSKARRVDRLQVLADALDRYFESVVDTITENGGDILEFSSDSLVALFSQDQEGRSGGGGGGEDGEDTPPGTAHDPQSACVQRATECAYELVTVLGEFSPQQGWFSNRDSSIDGVGSSTDYDEPFARDAGHGASPRQGAQPSLVLVVDDVSTHRLVLEIMLRRLGYDVVFLTDGDEAVEFMAGPRGEQVSCVLLDLYMPRMSGLEAAARIRALPNAEASSVHIALLSAQEECSISRIREEAQAVGIESYMTKPCSSGQLQSLLQTATSVPSCLFEGHPVPRRKRVLVADDVGTNRKALGKMLMQIGCEVDFAEDGEECVRKVLLEEQYDVVLMDVIMPILNGVEATRRIRLLADPLKSRTFIATISSSSDQAADSLNISDVVLTKPVGKEQLASLLESLDSRGQSPPAGRRTAVRSRQQKGLITLSLKVAVGYGKAVLVHAGGCPEAPSFQERWATALMDLPTPTNHERAVHQVRCACMHALAGDVVLTAAAWSKVGGKGVAEGEMLRSGDMRLKYLLASRPQLESVDQSVALPESVVGQIVQYVPSVLHGHLATPDPELIFERRTCSLVFLALPLSAVERNEVRGRWVKLEVVVNTIMRSVQASLAVFEGVLVEVKAQALEAGGSRFSRCWPCSGCQACSTRTIHLARCTPRSSSAAA